MNAMSSATRKTILLIDDEGVMHELTRAYLEKVGFRLLAAFDGPSGLELAVREHPDLILLDYMMPGMNGEEVFKQLMTDERFTALRNTPVIILTARGTSELSRLELLERGISAYLQKPFGLRELSNVIENVFVIHDISRRNVQLRSEVESTRDHLELMLRTAPLGIFSTDAKGFIKEINPPLCRLLGYEDPSDLLGVNILEDEALQSTFLRTGTAHVLEEGAPWQMRGLNFVEPSSRRAILNIHCVPLRSAEGLIAGGVGVVEDITDREKSDYQLRRLHTIGLAMQLAIDLDELLHLILTSITAGQAMGFSRAMIFLSAEQGTLLQGKMGVGPATAEDASRIWEALADEHISLEEFLEKYGKRKPDAHDAFDARVRAQRLTLMAEGCDFVSTIKKMQPYRGLPNAPKCLSCKKFLEALELQDFIAVPLVAKGKLIGLIIADNLYGTTQPIHNELVVQLELFARQAALAIEKADAYERLEEEKAKLEKAYSELKETHLRLVHSERLATVGKMAAHVAHEIRNPLVTIGGFARSLFKKAHDNEATEKIAGIIAEETMRLEKILANVLNFTRLPKPTFQPADLNKIASEACALLHDEALRQRIRLELRQTPLPTMMLDISQINQAMLNLMRNSMQSIGEPRSDDLKERGTITIATSVCMQGRVCLEVRDTGAGIPPDVLENMFNPFFTTKPQGIGLGLAITRQIINEHGGQIEVTSTLGRGTTFFIYLPINNAELEAQVSATSAVTSAV